MDNREMIIIVRLDGILYIITDYTEDSWSKNGID
jgi:hypothetical protein